MSSAYSQAKEDDDTLKYEQEYSPTMKYTSSPMTGEGEIREGRDREMEPEKDDKQSFGLLSDKFRHKVNSF